MERLKTKRVATRKHPTPQKIEDLTVVARTLTNGAPKNENIKSTAAVTAANEMVLLKELFCCGCAIYKDRV